MSEKINKIMADSLKNILSSILEEVKNKVRESGFDPESKEGKGLVAILYKKSLSRVGINLEEYAKMEGDVPIFIEPKVIGDTIVNLLEKNKAEISKELREELNNISIKLDDKSESFEKRITEVEKRKIDWEEILGKPEHTDKDHKKTIGDVELLFKNIISTRESLKDEFDKKIGGIHFKHKDLMGIKTDDHHPEKHILESHTESELMKKLIELIDKPPVTRYVGGGGDTIIADDLSAQCTGATRTFTTTHEIGKSILVVSSQFPNVLRLTVDFTASGRILSLDSALGFIESGQTLYFLYAEG